MNDSPSCPGCGKPLPSASPHGICPACLMAQAIASRTLDTGSSPGSAMPPPEPEEIADKFPQFEIIECLGRGGMGVVYKARQKSLNRIVALKILAPERERDAKFAARFAREAELLAKMSHPHIVTIHDFGETGGLYYLVMEFINGVNLRDLLREGKMPPEQALAIVPPVCEALQYAHEQGIVHRDIKPENILLDRDGRVKIADFGIASLAGDAGDPSGTPAYMAPEQQSVVRIVDHRADIYALGVVLYEMLTGERPTTLPVAPSRRIQIDVRLDEVVLRALENLPALRYQSAGEFKTVIESMVPAFVTSSSEVGRAAPLSPGLRQSVPFGGVDRRSRRTLWGIPLVHVASGVDPVSGRRRVARGWLAIGDSAVGFLAFGGSTRGVIAFGGVSVGLISFGGVSFGLVALGGVAIGPLFALGGMAIGGIALGGMAVGYYANGGGAMGMYKVSPMVSDPEAVRFFKPWAKELLSGMGAWAAAVGLLGVTINVAGYRWAAAPREDLPPKQEQAQDIVLGGKLLAHFAPAVILAVLWLTSGLERGAVMILSIVVVAVLVIRGLAMGRPEAERWNFAVGLGRAAAVSLLAFMILVAGGMFSGAGMSSRMSLLYSSDPLIVYGSIAGLLFAIAVTLIAVAESLGALFRVLRALRQGQGQGEKPPGSVPEDKP